MSPVRLREGVRKKSEIFFPDEIIVNILSWLPAENALRCRLVCKKGRDLTSTLDFEHLHFRRSIPMILVSHAEKHRGVRLDHFLLDKWWEPERKRLVYHRFFLDYECRYLYQDEYREQFSHGGLIVFQKSHRKHLLIFNPTSHENVKIILRNEPWDELWGSEIYGVFFHPFLEEYCTLWRLAKHGCDPDGHYKMLNLGSKPCWRDISNPWSHRVKVQSPDQGRLPVLIGDCLYWLVKPENENGYSGRVDVMKFDIRSESFGLMHCPVPSNVNCVHSNINLLDIHGVLSFILTSRKDNDERVNVRIWKLKDFTHQLWIPINHRIRVKDCPIYGRPQEIAVVGEELVLLLAYRLYFCNLKLGTARTFVKKKYNSPLVTFSHVMSLASLKNCKPRINMDKEGEVGEESDMT